MATRNNLSRTLEGGHEPFYDFPCSLCGDEGRHVESALYCEECLVYMCDPCVKSHNRIPLNRRHTLLDQGHFTAVSQSAIKSFPTKRCSKHSGELVNIFCGNHDIVCCSVCKALEHSTCSKTQHLPDAAKGIKTSTEYQNIRKDTQIFLSDLNKLVNDRKADTSRIDKEKQKVKRTIADFRKKLNKYFDDLEQKSLNELDLKQTLIISGLEEDRKYLDKTKKEAEEILKRLDTFRGDNECELFFHVKTSKYFIGESTERVEDISSTTPDSLVFKIDGSIENYLSSIPILGWFDDRHSATVQYSQEASGTGASSARRQDSKVAGPRRKGQTTTATPDNTSGKSADNTAPTNIEGSIENYQSSIPILGWFDDRHSSTVQYSQEASGTGASSARRQDSKGGHTEIYVPRRKDQTTTATPDNTSGKSADNTAPTNIEVNPVTTVVVGSRVRHNTRVPGVFWRENGTGTVKAVHPDGKVVVKWNYGGTDGPYTVGTGLGDVTLV